MDEVRAAYDSTQGSSREPTIRVMPHLRPQSLAYGRSSRPIGVRYAGVKKAMMPSAIASAR